ncbi:MAG: CARDB domain-containing protein [Acidimicrobiales bacterium]
MFTVTNNCCPYGEPWVGHLSVQRYNPASPRTFVTDPDGIELGRLSGPEPVAVGEITGDGKPDIVFHTNVLADGSSGERFAIYPGNGDGTFGAPIITAPGLPHLDQLLAADLRGTGATDLVGMGGGNLWVLLGNGDGTLQAPAPTPSPAYFDLILADLHGTGRRDLVAGSWSSGVVVHSVRTDGTLTPAAHIGTAEARVDGVAAAELFGSGRVDLISMVFTGPRVTVLENTTPQGSAGGKPDLRITSVTAPPSVTPGQDGSVTYTVRNDGGPIAGAGWVDRVYLSTDASWSPDDRLVGSAVRSTDLAAGASYTQTVTAPFLPLASGPHKVIVRSDLFSAVDDANRANNVLVMPGTVDLAIPVLAPGTAVDLTLAAGQLAYLQVAPSAVDQLLDTSSSVGGAAEVVAGIGRVPTPIDGRDVEADDPGAPAPPPRRRPDPLRAGAGPQRRGWRRDGERVAARPRLRDRLGGARPRLEPGVGDGRRARGRLRPRPDGLAHPGRDHPVGRRRRPPRRDPPRGDLRPHRPLARARRRVGHQPGGADRDRHGVLHRHRRRAGPHRSHRDQPRPHAHEPRRHGDHHRAQHRWDGPPDPPRPARCRWWCRVPTGGSDPVRARTAGLLPSPCRWAHAGPATGHDGARRRALHPEQRHHLPGHRRRHGHHPAPAHHHHR